jgi:hypothetical protein
VTFWPFTVACAEFDRKLPVVKLSVALLPLWVTLTDQLRARPSDAEEKQTDEGMIEKV